jgi:hypothetical protein
MSRQLFLATTALMPEVRGIQRAAGIAGAPGISPEIMRQIESIQRGANTDPNAAIALLTQGLASLNRGIDSLTSNLPIRENLEAEAIALVPTDTPLRNRIPRRMGSGTAVTWKQITSYGGGYGASSTVNGNQASGATTLTLVSNAGFRIGDFVSIGTGATIEVRQITALGVNTITFVGATANAQNNSAVVRIQTRPGGGSATRGFFGERGAPANLNTQYATRAAAYKLMGQMTDVTAFAQAAGRSFQDNRAQERTSALYNVMLNEENAILNGDSTSVLAPWGDGTSPLAFDGLYRLITTANGTPVDQQQAAVGALTEAHLDAQLIRLWQQGGSGYYMIISSQEAASLTKLAKAATNNYRYTLDQRGATLGVTVTGYVHPIASAGVVEVIVSRDAIPGIIVFGCDKTVEGKPTLEFEVLPQVDLPELAPNQQLMGYVVQQVGTSVAAPQVYPEIVTVFEVLKMKAANLFAISRGVAPA